METKRTVPPGTTPSLQGLACSRIQLWPVCGVYRSVYLCQSRPFSNLPRCPDCRGGRVAELRAILTLQGASCEHAGVSHVPGSPGPFVPGPDPATSVSKPTTPEIQFLIFKKVIASHLVD